jgi:2-phospho-L-lactate guanylyltransferase
MKALLIPVKAAANAKTRLAGLLTQEQRRRLTWAMFEDVASAAMAATEPNRIVVVSSNVPALEFAKGAGWDVLVEEDQESESSSVDWASTILRGQGVVTAMRLPADVPLVTAGDIDSLLRMKLNLPGAILVPSRERTGTNAIVRSPPDLFPSRFGPNSLHCHKKEAARVGGLCIVVENERLALDIDEPDDVGTLLRLGAGTKAYEVAREIARDMHIG